MVNKVVVSAISIVLVVGAVLGVVAIVHGKSNKDDDGGVVNAQKKAVSDFCSVSSYQESCKKSLGSANTTDPKELITKAVNVSQDAVKKFFDYANNLEEMAKSDNKTKMALENCKDLMDSAVSSLKKTMEGVGEAEMNNFQDSINDLRTWLSSVITYQETCKDGFDHNKTLQKEIHENILDSRHMATNALDIITKLTDVLSQYGLQQFALPTSRKLLSHDGYPEWLSGSRRKLLSVITDKNVKPTVVVAQDGSGQFKTIGEALAAYPKGNKAPYIVYVKTGTYQEYPVVEGHMVNVMMYGDGPTQTIVKGGRSTKGSTEGGFKTMNTATFAAKGEGFMARDMGFENTAGPKGEQAVAFRTSSDKCVVINCRFDGYQDTLYLHAERSFFKGITVTGTIDFIFGDSSSVIQDSTIIVRRPEANQKNIVAASGKIEKSENTGLVIQNCKIIADEKLQPDQKTIETYLARPWKPLATVVFIGNFMGELIKPEGYIPMEPSNKDGETCYLAEYNNNGPGANTQQRVKWKGVHPNIDKATAMKWTPKEVLHSKGPWLEETGIQINYNI